MLRARRKRKRPGVGTVSPKDCPGRGSRGHSRDKDPLRKLGCREQSWSVYRLPLVSDSVPSCPVPGRGVPISGKAAQGLVLFL